MALSNTPPKDSKKTHWNKLESMSHFYFDIFGGKQLTLVDHQNVSRVSFTHSSQKITGNTFINLKKMGT